MTINILESGQGYPLVLFHGWGFDSQIWEPLLADLSYTVYRVDLPGFGLTPWMDWSAFQSSLLNRLPATFAVAGWSLGGLYASRLAIENPHKVSHLLNIASSPRFLETESWPGVKIQVLENFYKNLEKDPAQTLRDFQALQKHHPLPPQSHIPTSQGLSTGLDILKTWDFREAIRNLTIPTCYLFGRLDAIIPAATLPDMQKNYPHLQYALFKKSAHMPFLSEKPQFLALLQEFLP